MPRAAGRRQLFVFARYDRGCISRPLPDAPWLRHAFGKTAVFTAAKPTDGQLAFLVSDDTQRVRVLIAPASGGGLVVPAGAPRHLQYRGFEVDEASVDLE
jgi:hypothetical protein